ncbi:helix-turn-helix domain-containing protein [Paenibacillus sp. 2TAB23]|uniref:helix-turn-helix domain-containing protein n=1 Tax=Paenibacillus sp. 2TAB23 TaxID=3233004 RepID=UPI003F94A5D3
MMDLVEFGEYLKSIRKKKELTLKDVSNEAEISHAYLSQIENGKKANYPSSEVLIKLSRVLGIYYAELLQAAGYIEGEEILGDDKYLEQLNDERYRRSVDVVGEDEPYWTDLNNLLTLEPEITFRNRLITNEERKIILAYIEGLFAQKQ